MSRGKPTKAAKVWGCRPPLELESQLDDLLHSWRAQIEKSGTGEKPPSKSDLVTWMLSAGVHKFKREVLGERTRSKQRTHPAPRRQEPEAKPKPAPKRPPARPKPEPVPPTVITSKSPAPGVDKVEPKTKQQEPGERRAETAGERRDAERPVHSAGRRNYDILKRYISVKGIEDAAQLLGVSVGRVHRATEDPTAINRMKWEAFINHPEVKSATDSLL